MFSKLQLEIYKANYHNCYSLDSKFEYINKWNIKFILDLSLSNKVILFDKESNKTNINFPVYRGLQA